MSEIIASLQSVTKSFAGVTAVDDISLDILGGEFFSILGPSGCGKTTTLRMLGGFAIPDDGRIVLAGRNVTNIPPYRRDVNTVFQSYALFEHLSVAENVAFGLKRKKISKSETLRRVREMLELVNLADRAAARPRELSGGQQQRVALIRALVNMPAILLLDEPLSALDLKLRRQMQSELKTIQREVGITFVFVTHDQEEALTMSDRIAIMNDGRIEQVDTTTAIYERPTTAFAASFIGASNLLAGTVSGGCVDVDGLAAAPLPENTRGLTDGEAVVLSVRPEKVLISPDTGAPAGGFPAVVTEAVYLGASTEIELVAGNGVTLRATHFHPPGEASGHYRAGDRVRVTWAPSDSLVFAAPPPTPETAAASRPDAQDAAQLGGGL